MNLLRRRVIQIVAVLVPGAAIAAACDGRVHDTPRATLAIDRLLGGPDTLHARAIAPREFTFPDDHGPHPEFRTEWWYFTGNLTTDDGRELGYQLTFFRSALTDSASFAAAAAADTAAADTEAADTAAAETAADTAAAETAAADAAASRAPSEQSAWRSRHAYMAHFAVTDGGTGRFDAAETFSRGAAGLAGAEAAPLRVWLDDWSVESVSTSTFPVRLRASAGDIAIDLLVERGKPIVLQGERGLSRKGPEPGNASYYYSLTRMPTRGSVRTGAGTWTAIGTSWLDREWSTSVLSPGVAGWDWLSLQMSDSTELMTYRLRRADGSVDPFSAATFVTADGSTRGFAADEFLMSPLAAWRSADGVEYPIEWRIEVPSLELMLEVSTRVEEQELALSVRYWEGMVRAQGTRAGSAVSARGYLEMTGYTGSAETTR